MIESSEAKFLFQILLGRNELFDKFGQGEHVMLFSPLLFYTWR